MITLKDAIYLEKIDEVKRILEENPPLIDEVDEDGVLMALLAAKTGNLNLVRYIVEYSRASMNITDKNQKICYTMQRCPVMLRPVSILWNGLDCHRYPETSIF